MKFILKTFIIFIVSLLIVGNLAFAQSDICLGGYDRDDRETMVSISYKVENVFDRIRFIAEDSAKNWQVYSETQLRAYDAEAQALIGAIEGIGESEDLSISDRSKEFLVSVVKSDFLGLNGLTVLGSNPEERSINARNLLDEASVSQDKLNLCLFGSWDRQQIVGTQNDDNCGGGYSRFDIFKVLRFYIKARLNLHQMRLLTLVGKNGIMGIIDRKLLNFDLDYFKEDLELIGNETPVRVSQRTARFIRTVFDPIFLGIDKATVYAPRAVDAIRLSSEAYIGVNNAIRTLRECVFAQR